ncbi:MAG TPA: D-glucuronyl C5-epimerase family protein, partial [Solirubrobacteraceae bacterium]
AVAGYPIDLRVKARTPRLPATVCEPEHLHVDTAQFGLGAHERWLAGQGQKWLHVAIAAGRQLVAVQEPNGAWLHRADYPHTFPLRAPWCSAMAQGEGASLLVRLHAITGDATFAQAAARAVMPLSRDLDDGGVRTELGGAPWLEEYPTRPSSYVLNGAIFALWGLRDVGVGLGDQHALRAFDDGVDALAANLHRFDTGWWSLYSRYPHPLRNPASGFYHALHLSQLEGMQRLAPRPQFAATHARWAAYAASRACRTRAFAAKVMFRLAVPRR